MTIQKYSTERRFSFFKEKFVLGPRTRGPRNSNLTLHVLIGQTLSWRVVHLPRG